MFSMWEFWKNGISPNEFKRTSLNDIKKIINIENAINERIQRYQKTQRTIAKMRRKW